MTISIILSDAYRPSGKEVDKIIQIDGIKNIVLAHHGTGGTSYNFTFSTHESFQEALKATNWSILYKDSLILTSYFLEFYGMAVSFDLYCRQLKVIASQ